MAVLRWDPWGELAALQRDVNELFGRTTTPGRAAAGLVPAIDAFRTEDGLVVRVELPGLDRGDVDVAVNEGMLTISGERKVDADVPEDAWVRRERAVGGFERSFSLPEGTDPSAISASFDRGLLELHLPHPPERRPRKIEITSSEPAQDAVEVGSGTGTHSGSSS